MLQIPVKLLKIAYIYNFTQFVNTLISFLSLSHSSCLLHHHQLHLRLKKKTIHASLNTITAIEGSTISKTSCHANSLKKKNKKNRWYLTIYLVNIIASASRLGTVRFFLEGRSSCGICLTTQIDSANLHASTCCN